MTDKTTAALKLAEEALYAELESDTCEEFAEAAEKCHKAIAAIREVLAEPEITTPDVCGEVCARAKLCYGCGKALDEANAKLAQPVKQEPVAKVTDVFPTRVEWLREVAVNSLLYASPVDVKAIRAEALEEAAKWFEDEEHPLQPKKVAAAIRGA